MNELRAARDLARQGRIQPRPEPPYAFADPWFYRGWRRDEGGPGPARVEIEKLKLPVETSSGCSHLGKVAQTT
jgi:hypothetical protein